MSGPRRSRDPALLSTSDREPGRRLPRSARCRKGDRRRSAPGGPAALNRVGPRRQRQRARSKTTTGLCALTPLSAASSHQTVLFCTLLRRADHHNCNAATSRRTAVRLPWAACYNQGSLPGRVRNRLMKRILVTNDDGVHSDGIHALAAALAPLGDVTIVAPHVEASAIGHALTLRRPLRMERLRERVYEVDGTPTDCVNIAITQVYTPSSVPDLIVSGINKGWNLGDDVTYSGTVAGALEGSLLGISSI